MKRNVLLGIALALVMSATALPVVTSFGQAAPADNLEKVMGRMGKTLKALKKQIADPAQQATALTLVGQFQKDVLIAKEMTPPGLPKEAEANAKAIADYRMMLLNVLRQSLDLEEAIQDKKADEAAKIITTMESVEKEGHKEFRKEEPK